MLAVLRAGETPDGIACRPELPCAVTPPECGAALGRVLAARRLLGPRARLGSAGPDTRTGHFALPCLAADGGPEPARVIREREEYADEGGEVLT